jgi:hypothetical protein
LRFYINPKGFLGSLRAKIPYYEFSKKTWFVQALTRHNFSVPTAALGVGIDQQQGF